MPVYDRHPVSGPRVWRPGAALVVEQIRRQYGCRDVYTTVDDENARAVKLYQEFGFRPTGEMDETERVYVLRGEEG